MTWGITYAAYPKLKIIHRAGRVHTNVDPISRLHRRIPFYNSPDFANDLLVELNIKEPINFYEKYHHKLESMAYTIFKSLEQVHAFNMVVQHETIKISYNTSTKMETHLYFDPQELQAFTQAYLKDGHFAEVLQAIRTNDSHFPQYNLQEDSIILFKNWSGYSRVCVPRPLVFDILKEVHDNVTGVTHAGYQRTYARISQGFYWPKMSKDIKKFVASCPICQKTKHQRHAPYGQLQPIPIPEKPFDVVTMDLITSLPESNGFNAIFVLVCKLTKYAFFIPCNTTLNEKQAAKLFFDNIVCHVGLPKQVISD
jgi:hypothetical protein